MPMVSTLQAPSTPTQCIQYSSAISDDNTQRSRSTPSPLGRRCSPVALPTTSNPRHMVVATEELTSRNELLRSLPCRCGISRPCSSSSSAQLASMSAARLSDEMGSGREADGESLRVSAACAWTSSTSSWNRASIADTVRSWYDCDRDRTTSPLHIGQVRRLVTSHGVLRRC
jgi:hypothetical protein